MQNKVTPFFATDNDLMRFISQVTCMRQLQFVIGGLFDSPIIHHWAPPTKIDPTANYLIAHRDLVIEARSVPQRQGGQKFAIDQFINPRTIVLRAGGMIKECLIAGQFGTSTDDQTSDDLYRLFSSEIRKQFAKVKSYYLGKEASLLLDEGVRLTTNPKSPPIYDLSR